MATPKVFESDGELVDVKPVRRKRKKPDTSTAPSGRNKAPRRSGRVRRPPSPLEGSGAKYLRTPNGARRRKYTEILQSPSPSPEVMSSHLRTLPTSSPSPPPAHNDFPVDSVQDMFDSLERDLHTEQDRSQRQLREIDKLKQQLREHEKKLNSAWLGGTVPARKKDRVIGETNDNIEELKEKLSIIRDLRTASRLALDTRNKELENLRQKHRSLIKAAKVVTYKWGGMGELAQAVEDATE